MNATGLLLGAGASYDLGMPLVQELTAELKRWLTPNKLEELNSGWRASGLVIRMKRSQRSPRF